MEPDPRESIRLATLADAGRIAQIYNESIALGDATMDERTFTAEDISRQMRGFGARELYLVLERGDAVLGWGRLERYSDRAGYRDTAETAVYLSRGELGRGHGTRLKRALIERARAHGYHHLVAKVFADNAASLASNRRCGFELVGVQREVGVKKGERQDVAILQLILGECGGS